MLTCHYVGDKCLIRKRRVFLCKDAERSMISAKGKHGGAKTKGGIEYERAYG